MNDAISRIVRDPEWLAHRYDAGHDAFQFIRVDRDARARAAFLTDVEMRPASPQAIRRQDALDVTTPQAPIHFVFHSAYCCSTLLARSLDVPETSMALKEPQVLNDLVGWRHRGADPAKVGPVLDAALRLLERPFRPGEQVIVKPSNVISALMDPILAVRPQSRAVLLYAPLDVFLTSIARKGLDGRLWVRELLSKQLVDGTVDLGFSPRDYLLLTDLQAAAVGWLAQHVMFVRLASMLPARCRMLDSEALVARPGEMLTAVAQFFDLGRSPADWHAIAEREFSRDAKSGSAFHAGQRAAERSHGAAIHRDEIEKVTAWASAIARHAGARIEAPQSASLAIGK